MAVETKEGILRRTSKIAAVTVVACLALTGCGKKSDSGTTTTGSEDICTTAKGDGLVPVRELGLAPGADLRKAFPLGRELTVVVMDVDDRGRIRFSAKEVTRVEEQKNFREFTEGGAEDETAEAAPAAAGSKPKPKVDRGPRNFGSLGDVFADKLKNVKTKGAPATPDAPNAPNRRR